MPCGEWWLLSKLEDNSLGCTGCEECTSANIQGALAVHPVGDISKTYLTIFYRSPSFPAQGGNKGQDHPVYMRAPI